MDKRSVHTCTHGNTKLFSLPDLFDGLTKKISCCRMVRYNTKGMSQDLLPPNKQLK
jgi:hypothetical protein